MLSLPKLKNWKERKLHQIWLLWINGHKHTSRSEGTGLRTWILCLIAQQKQLNQVKAP